MPSTKRALQLSTAQRCKISVARQPFKSYCRSGTRLHQEQKKHTECPQTGRHIVPSCATNRIGKNIKPLTVIASVHETTLKHNNQVKSFKRLLASFYWNKSEPLPNFRAY